MTTPTTPASTTTWPTTDTSMVAQMGDTIMEMEVDEVRTIRILDNTMDADRANEEEDDAREGSGANGRGRGQDGKTRDL